MYSRIRLQIHDSHCFEICVGTLLMLQYSTILPSPTFFVTSNIPMSSSANQAGVVVRGSTFRVVGYAASILVSFFLMPFLVHSLGDRIY